MSEQLPSRALGTAASSRSVLAHSGFGEPEAALAPLDLRAALAVLRRHRWIVAGVTAVSVAVAAYIGFMTPPTYRATAVARLARAREALTAGIVEGPLLARIGESADPLLSQIEVLKSRAVAGAVVDSLPVLRTITRGFTSRLLGDLRFTTSTVPDSLELLFQGDGVVIRGEGGQARAPYGTPVEIEGIELTVLGQPLGKHGKLLVIDRDSAVSALLGRLRVTPRQKTDVIDVSYTANDPERARQVVNSVVAVFQGANARAAQQQARLQRQFIEAQLQRTDSLLAAAREALSTFRRRQGIERTEQSGPASSQSDAGQLLVRREESNAERRILHGLLVRLGDKGVGQRRDALRAVVSLPGIAVNLEVAGLYGQLVRYETTLDSLRSGRWAIAGTHPDVQRLNELVTSIEARLVPAVQNAVQNRLASLDATIATLDALRARKASTFERLSEAEGEEARLAEQVGNASKIADQLRTEQQKARIAEAVEVGQVEIVDLAPLPAAPIGVGVMRILTFGLLLGLLLGGTSAFVADQLNRSISRPKDVAQLGLPVLGVVPHVARARNGAGTQKAMPVVEALRGIRFNLAHAYGAAGPLLVTITSPGSREGKSFIASNLALAFAEASQRTVLIDADVRRGGLHRLLRARRKPGLTDLLKGEASREEVVQSTAHPSLSFVGCGTRNADAPELLCSAAMSQLVTGLRSSYGVIIIDSPPLGAGVDAFALGTMTANILMVLRVGATDREVAEVKLDLLGRLPVRILGVVLNDVRDGSLYEPYAYYMAGYEAESEKRTGRRVLGAE